MLLLLLISVSPQGLLVVLHHVVCVTYRESPLCYTSLGFEEHTGWYHLGL